MYFRQKVTVGTKRSVARPLIHPRVIRFLEIGEAGGLYLVSGHVSPDVVAVPADTLDPQLALGRLQHLTELDHCDDGYSSPLGRN
jgi:hypothetical protein